MKKKISRNKPLQHLSVLKMKLVNEDNFHEIYTYFFDHLGEDDAFMSMGKQKRNPKLEKAIAVSAQEALNTKTIVIRDMFLIYLRQHRFTHGCARINGLLSSYFYFADIDVGMLALAPYPGTGDGETRFVRFTLRELRGRPTPSPN